MIPRLGSRARSSAHRPWPPPSAPWIMAQSWHDLLFAHWPISVAELRRLVPAVLPIDTFDGQAWVGVVPFRMTGVRLRWMPNLPRISAFPEINVRTYVTVDGKPGVYFFSLDAANPLAVTTARRWFRLPYFLAQMSCIDRDGEVVYSSLRTDRLSGPAEFVGRYRPVGDVSLSAPGSLAAFLTERYCLYTVDPRGRVRRAEILHDPWPLQPAEADIARNTMLAPLDLALPRVPPVLFFSRRLDVVIWPPRLL